MNIAIVVHHGVRRTEGEELSQYLDLTRELRKVVEHEGNCDISRSLELIGQSARNLKRDWLNWSKNFSQTTAQLKSATRHRRLHGIKRRLAIIQTSVTKYQFELV